MQKRNFVAKFQKFQRFKFQKGQVTVSKAILEGQYKYQTLQDSFPNLPEGSIWKGTKIPKIQIPNSKKGKITVAKTILERLKKYQTLQDSFANLPEGSIWKGTKIPKIQIPNSKKDKLRDQKPFWKDNISIKRCRIRSPNCRKAAFGKEQKFQKTKFQIPKKTSYGFKSHFGRTI